MVMGSLQPLPLLVDPERDLAVGDVDQVGQAIAVHIAEQHALRVELVRQATGAIVHGHARGPSGHSRGWASNRRGPGGRATMSCRPSPDMSANLTRGSEKLTLGKLRVPGAGRARCAGRPAPVGIVEEALQGLLPERRTSVTPSPVEVDQAAPRGLPD